MLFMTEDLPTLGHPTKATLLNDLMSISSSLSIWLSNCLPYANSYRNVRTRSVELILALSMSALVLFPTPLREEYQIAFKLFESNYLVQRTRSAFVLAAPWFGRHDRRKRKNNCDSSQQGGSGAKGWPSTLD
jgi:hypothetical protein